MTTATPSKLEQLASLTDIVADTGDLAAIQRLTPLDATTNPSLLLKLAQSAQGSSLLADAHHLAATLEPTPSLALLSDAFAALAGKQISAVIPGWISTEVDARLSFDVPAMLQRARRLHLLYHELGVGRERILIKLAATWQGIQAAEVLETERIACNMTLLFNMTQAIACARAKATLISPFVGRIHDWYAKQGVDVSRPEQDPGVQSVKAIFEAYKSRNVNTIIMGASFRNTGQIEALAGCDKLTISPELLDQLAADTGKLTTRLSQAAKPDAPAFTQTHSQFLLEMTQDAMASDLLADGIRRFIKDQETLETLLTEQAQH